MTDIFLKILGMSATACIIIAVVLLLRLALKKAPKLFSYILWAAVFFRLLCPFAFGLPVGLTPIDVQAQAGAAYRSDDTPDDDVLPETIYAEPDYDNIPPLKNAALTNAGYISREIPVPAAMPCTEEYGEPEATAALVAPEAAEAEIVHDSTFMNDLFGVLAAVWFSGACAMALYGVISYIRLRKQLKFAFEEDGCLISENIRNPFILGIFRPRIYLPEGLDEEQREFIILHEKAHIRRFDHIAKIVMYLALCIHWFNPLVWLSFRLCEKDMEMSVDQRITSDMPSERKADYSQTLLSVTAGRAAAFTACFGESSVKQRVRNVLYYKKPALWTVIVCIVGITAAMVLMMTDKVSAAKEEETFYQKHFVTNVEDNATVPPCLLYNGEYYAALMSSEYDPCLEDVGVLKNLSEYIGMSIPVPERDAQPMKELEMTKSREPYELYRRDENTVLAAGTKVWKDGSENLLLVKLELPLEKQEEIRKKCISGELARGSVTVSGTVESKPARALGNDGFERAIKDIIDNAETLGEAADEIKKIDKENRFYYIKDTTFYDVFTVGYKQKIYDGMKVTVFLDLGRNKLETTVHRKGEPPVLVAGVINAITCSYDWSYKTSDGWNSSSSDATLPKTVDDYADSMTASWYDLSLDDEEMKIGDFGFVPVDAQPDDVYIECWRAEDHGKENKTVKRLEVRLNDQVDPEEDDGFYLGQYHLYEKELGDYIYKVTASWNGEKYRGTVVYTFRANLQPTASKPVKLVRPEPAEPVARTTKGAYSFFYNGYEYVTDEERHYFTIKNGYHVIDKRMVTGEIQPEGGVLDVSSLPKDKVMSGAQKDWCKTHYQVTVTDDPDPKSYLVESAFDELAGMDLYFYPEGHKGYSMLLIGSEPVCSVGGVGVFEWAGVPMSYYEELTRAINASLDAPENITPTGYPIVPKATVESEYTSYELPPSLTAVCDGERMIATLNGYNWQYKSGDEWITVSKSTKDPMDSGFIRKMNGALHVSQPHKNVEIIMGAPISALYRAENEVSFRSMEPEKYGAYETGSYAWGGGYNSRYSNVFILEKGKYMVQITKMWDSEEYKGSATYNFIVECDDYPDEQTRMLQGYIADKVVYDDEEYYFTSPWRYFTRIDGVYYSVNMSINEKSGKPESKSQLTLTRDDIIADIFSYRSVGHTTYSKDPTADLETDGKVLAGMRVYLFRSGYDTEWGYTKMVLRTDKPLFYVEDLPIYMLMC